jgi:RTX calcium-binding nonapeptide repeat (4 copies)
MARPWLPGLLCTALAVAAWLAAPGPADAGTAFVEQRMVPDPEYGDPVQVSFLHYEADPGERNSLRVTFDNGDGPEEYGVDEYAIVEDLAGVTAGEGCTSEAGTTVVRCRLPNDGFDQDIVLEFEPLVHAWLGDLDDRASVEGSPHVEGEGAALHGGPGADELRGGAAANELSGGDGEDILVARGHYNAFLEGPAANGADTMIMRGTYHSIDYSERDAPVRVDLDGKADDGEFVPGEEPEGDRIVGLDEISVEGGSAPDSLTGGFGRDRLAGNGGGDILRGLGGHDGLFADTLNRRTAGSRRSGDRLYGGTGSDELWGNAGDNVLVGGSKPDRVVGGGGRDTVRARDGAPDRVVCGPGADRAILDAVDFWRRRGGPCERAVRPAPATAAFAGVDELVWFGEPLGIGSRRAYGDVGCPADAPPRCVGTAWIARRGRVLGSAAIDIARDRRVQVELRLTPLGWSLYDPTDPVRVTFAVRSLDRHGIPRVTAVHRVPLGG